MGGRLIGVDKEDELKVNRKNHKENVATGFSTVGIRALTSRLVAFYFRAPVKAFARARIEGYSSMVTQLTINYVARMSDVLQLYGNP